MSGNDSPAQTGHIGGATPLTGPVELVEYDVRWPEQYAVEADRLRSVLGARALRVEHAGSTSVSGLAAKPLLDMILVVADSAAEESYVDDLVGAGYVLRIREPDWFEHRVLRGPGFPINLHVFSAGCPEVDRMLLFRDWLRTHPADRDLYERTKRELATRRWTYLQEYADAKTDVVAEIVARAEAAAAES